MVDYEFLYWKLYKFEITLPGVQAFCAEHSKYIRGKWKTSKNLVCKTYQVMKDTLKKFLLIFLYQKWITLIVANVPTTVKCNPLTNILKTFCAQVFHCRGHTSQPSNCLFSSCLPTQNKPLFNLRWPPNASLFPFQTKCCSSLLKNLLITAPSSWQCCFLSDASLLGRGFIIFICLDLCWRVVECVQVYLKLTIAVTFPVKNY